MRRKHVPVRTCVGCRKGLPKRELIRVVRSPEGEVELDLTSKKPGRGVYICFSAECLNAAVKDRQLERGLKTKINKQVLDSLQLVLLTKPTDNQKEQSNEQGV